MAEVRFDVDDPVLAAVAWGRLAEPGDRSAGALVDALGHSEALRWLIAPFPAGEAAITRARQGWLARLDVLDPEREVAAISRLGGEVLFRDHPRWPTAMSHLGHSAPHCLWVRGDTELPAKAREGGLAVVGARACTPYGEHVTSELVASLAAEGRVIVSGGAYGIDAAAHRAALAVGGPTLSVMAGGMDRFYPAGNADLLARVAREGAVLSELGPGSSPSRSRFLTRNRLIAALTAGCVVVEAGWRSGTLSTANHAAALLRPVGAVPGPVTSAASAGCHRLLREGQAVCVTDAAEVRELLGPAGALAPEHPEQVRHGDPPPGLADRERRVWEALPARGLGRLESIIRASGMGAEQVRAGLGRLELLGYAARDGDRYRRTGR